MSGNGDGNGVAELAQAPGWDQAPDWQQEGSTHPPVFPPARPPANPTYKRSPTDLRPAVACIGNSR